MRARSPQRYGQSIDYKIANGDFDDPFAPDVRSSAPVRCLHCGDTYQEKDICWNDSSRAWCCPNFFNSIGCDGAGYGFDIFPLTGE